MSEFTDISERILTHTRSATAAGMGAAEALQALSAVIVVACLQLPPDVAEAVIDRMQKSISRLVFYNEANTELHHDFMEIYQMCQKYETAVLLANIERIGAESGARE